MRLPDFVARPHPAGHRIDLSWTIPPDAGVTGVRLVRREGTHPAHPGDGTVVAEGPAVTAARDDGLPGERVQYYTLFVQTAASAPGFSPPPWSRLSATATASHDLARLMYALLPGIYRRYDAAAGPVALPLARFLGLPGAVLDQLYSLARITEAAHDLERVDGRLLPLLAQWIGWPTDHTQEVRTQRAEVRAAPHLYQRLGAVPTAVATVGRITGRSAHLKEFVHNVARTNEPERLNLWASVRAAGQAGWTEAALASVNHAFEGRAAHVRDTDGTDLFVFHTRRRHGWDIWAKRRILDPVRGPVWAPSEPVVDRPGHDRHPVVVRQGERLWLFWDSPGAGSRHDIWFSVHAGGRWTPPAVVDAAPPGSADRRNPAAVVDAAGGLWLFWIERAGSARQIRFRRHDGTGWQLAEPGVVPVGPAGVQDDLSALFHPDDGGRIWLFWARLERSDPGPPRWRVALTVKQSTDVAADDWGAVRTVAPTASGAHDREPAPLRSGTGVELFWATTRDGGWSVVRALLDGATFDRDEPQRIGDEAATRRAPLAAVTADGATVLLVRSNAALRRGTGATADTTLDTRDAGTTTVRVQDTAKQGLRGRFGDLGTYTYQCGTHRPGRPPARTDRHRVARDTVGVFLGAAPQPGPDPEAALVRLVGVLPDFLPVGARPVMITDGGA